MSIEENIADRFVYSQPGDPQAVISDEHIEKLEINDECVLLIRVPLNMAPQQGEMIMATIRKIVQRKTGNDPGILLVARDCDLAALDIESLSRLRDEIDASIQYRYARQGENKGN